MTHSAFRVRRPLSACFGTRNVTIFFALYRDWRRHVRQYSWCSVLPNWADWRDDYVTHLCQPINQSIEKLGPTVFGGKFCQILQASLQNSVAYCRKVVQIMQFTAAYCLWVNYFETSVIEGCHCSEFASNIQRRLSIFYPKIISKLCLFTIVPYCDSYF